MISVNTSYLNRTPNKTARAITTYKPRFVVWHETGGFGSLDWNLKPSVRASFNYLITRDGTIYHYVDERAYQAWHAGIGPAGTVNGVYYGGLSRWAIGSAVYTGGNINAAAIGVEIEGKNNGEPITAAQRDSAVALLKHFNEIYGIPIVPEYHPEHAQVAPVYKVDALGYDIRLLLALATDQTPAQIFAAAYDRNGGAWRGPGLLSLGYPIGSPFLFNGMQHQRYERAVGRIDAGTVVWLLLSELSALP